MSQVKIWTIKELLTWTTGFFVKHHIDSPRLDAELLLSKVLGISRIHLYTNFDEIVNQNELASYREYIKKRISGYSTASIIGEKEFMGIVFHVDDHVLIPRPDTETWVEKIIQYHRHDEGIMVADLGTGSGCILLSFLHYCPGAQGIGIDISERALAIAKENGESLHLNNRAEWREGDYTNALHEGELVDGILTNPPYIPKHDIPGLDMEVKREPIEALDGGDDGLDFYRRLAKDGALHIKEGGFLACEVGIHQAVPVQKMLENTGAFDSFEVIQDLGGIDRAIYCKRKSHS